jgi:hypothetical protein
MADLRRTTAAGYRPAENPKRPSQGLPTPPLGASGQQGAALARRAKLWMGDEAATVVDRLEGEDDAVRVAVLAGHLDADGLRVAALRQRLARTGVTNILARVVGTSEALGSSKEVDKRGHSNKKCADQGGVGAIKLRRCGLMRPAMGAV